MCKSCGVYYRCNKQTICLENLEGTVLVESWGEKGIFYNPDHVLKRGVYILTVKEKDGDNDPFLTL